MKYCTGCCVVSEVENPLDSVIRPGDILLKINDISLIGSVSSPFDIKVAIQLINLAARPRTIRFMRIAGNAYIMLPSPIELNLYMKELIPVSQFVVEETTNIDGKLTKSIELSVHDDAIQVILV